MVWSVFWFWLVTELPRNHPSISDEELEYIESSLGSSVADQKVIPLFLVLLLVPLKLSENHKFSDDFGGRCINYFSQIRFIIEAKFGHDS